MSVGQASRAVERAQSKLPGAHLARAQQVLDRPAVQRQSRLDLLLVEAWAVLKRAHITVSHGRIVRDDTTDEPILDDGPTLAAIDRIRAAARANDVPFWGSEPGDAAMLCGVDTRILHRGAVESLARAKETFAGNGG